MSCPDTEFSMCFEVPALGLLFLLWISIVFPVTVGLAGASCKNVQYISPYAGLCCWNAILVLLSCRLVVGNAYSSLFFNGKYKPQKQTFQEPAI